jgi:hypothetical protein
MKRRRRILALRAQREEAQSSQRRKRGKEGRIQFAQAESLCYWARESVPFFF